MNAFMIAGTNSGVGKTSITLGLIRLFQKKNLSVQAFKVGPDFIDTGYHAFLSNKPAINLDSWMLSKDYNIENFLYYSKNNKISIIEGVMGLYDGFSTTDDDGSSALIAKWLKVPVILVVNASSMARSAAAIVKGFETFDPNINIVGVIFNHVSGENHYSYLSESVSHYCNAKPLGYIPKNSFKPLPSRHLGLVTIEDSNFEKNFFDEYAMILEKHINIDKLLSLTKYKTKIFNNIEKKEKSLKKNIKIGVAKDKAFCFYYHDNIEILKKFGAEIIFFSPLNDKKLPDNLDALYFGGGYPELYSKELSANKQLLSEIKNFSEKKKIIYAECGGFMYLTKGIIDTHNNFFELVGIFDDIAVMNKKLSKLGYAEINIIQDTFFGKNIKAKGHEFHYSHLKYNGEKLAKVYEVKMRKGLQKFEGYKLNNTVGSYIHLHFGSNLEIIKNLISFIENQKNISTTRGLSE